MAALSVADQLRDLSSLFKLEERDWYSVSMRDANYIVLLARGAARDIEDLQKKANALEHWRHEVGKLQSRISTLTDTIRWCLERDERNGSLPEAYVEKLRAVIGEITQ
jgi:hypothetical protein